MKFHKTIAPLSPEGLRRYCSSFLLFTVLTVAVIAQSAGAASIRIPELVRFRGTVSDDNGIPLGAGVPENYRLIFRIYPSPVGGRTIWTEEQIVSVLDGAFETELGRGRAFQSEPSGPVSQAFSGRAGGGRFVGVTVKGAAGEIAPRHRLLASPFAYVAEVAHSLLDATGRPVLRTGRDGVTLLAANDLIVNDNVLANRLYVTNPPVFFKWAEVQVSDLPHQQRGWFLKMVYGGKKISYLRGTNDQFRIDTEWNGIVLNKPLQVENGGARIAGPLGIHRSLPQSALHVEAALSGRTVIDNKDVYSVLRSDIDKAASSWELGHAVAGQKLAWYHNGVAMMALGTNSGGHWLTPGDRRGRKNIEDLETGSLKKLTALTPRRFHFTRQSNRSPKTAGLIAQEVKEVFPDAVADLNGELALDFNQLTVYSLAAIRDMNRTTTTEIQGLKKQNEQLLKTVSELLLRIKALEAK